MVNIPLLQYRKLLLILSFFYFCSMLHNIEIIAKEEVLEIEQIVVTINTLNQYGEHINGKVGMNYAADPSGYAYTIKHGAKIIAAGGVFDRDYENEVRKVVTVLKDTTYSIDVTGEEGVLTSKPTQEVTEINFIFKVVKTSIAKKRQDPVSTDDLTQVSTNTALTYRWIDKRSKGNTEIASWQRVGVGGEVYLDLKKLRPYPVGAHTLILEVNDKQNEFTPEMVLVDGGCFQMGNFFDEGAKYEKPVHEVCVDDFYIGKYEITQGEWETVMGSNPSTFKGNLNRPVEHVSYHDVIDFINKLRLRTGKKYRLPTEAEWEFAARSGGQDELWAGISDVFELEDYAWYKDSSDGRTHPVGQKKPNKIGLYDMSGNVWEWIWDRFDTEYYETSPKNNPKGPLNGEYRVIRGGSWSNYPRYIRSVDRGWVNPDGIYVDGGFRLALSAH